MTSEDIVKEALGIGHDLWLFELVGCLIFVCQLYISLYYFFLYQTYEDCAFLLVNRYPISLITDCFRLQGSVRNKVVMLL